MIKNLFSGQSLLELINDKGEEKVKACYKLSWSTTIWSNKYQLYGNKGDVANVYFKRKSIILKKDKLKIRIREASTYLDLIRILKNKESLSSSGTFLSINTLYSSGKFSEIALCDSFFLCST